MMLILLFRVKRRNGAENIQMWASRNGLPGYSRKLFLSTPCHPLLTLNVYQVCTTVSVCLSLSADVASLAVCTIRYRTTATSAFLIPV